MSNPNSELDSIDKEEEKRIKEFVLTLLPLLGLINGVSSYNSIFSQVNQRVDSFMLQYKTLISDTIFDEITHFNHSLSLSNKQRIVSSVFEQTFKIVGTNNKISFQEILLRRGEKLKNDIAQQFLFDNGFNQASQKTLNSVVQNVLGKNQKSLARIISNETHKAVIQSDIENSKQQGTETTKKVFEYNTQNDKRVRPTHARYNGEQLTVTEAQALKNSIMSDPGCRCYLTLL